jgi:GNAT superfamily N-acetyltransferase
MLAKKCKFGDNDGAETHGHQQPQSARGCTVRVRRANQEDKTAFVKQAEAFFAASPMSERADFDENGFAKFYDQAIESDTIAFWVVDRAGEVVGISGAMAFPLYFAPTVKIAQELFWWIEPDARGTSAGKQMMFEIEGWAEQIGANHLFMIALENDRSKTMERVYGRNGFSPIERTFTKEIRHGH